MRLRTRTLTTVTEYHSTDDGERSHQTVTRYRRLWDEPFYSLHFAPGRHCRTRWMRRNEWFKKTLAARVVG